MNGIHEYHLQNGMTILCCPQNHLHSLMIGLYLHGGSLYENRQNQGIGHLLEHLCFRSLGGMTPAELNTRLDRMGTDLDGATYPEAIVFRLRTHSRYFDDAADLFRQFFTPYEWTEEQIAKEKQVVLRQIEQEEDDFDEMAERRFRRTQAGAFPLMGTAETVTAMTPLMIRRWKKAIFRPANAILTFTGNFSQAMEDALTESFGELEDPGTETGFEQKVPDDFCMRDERSDRIEVSEADGQAKVHIAFDINEDLIFPLAGEVLNAYTGADNDSLLFQTLREDEALVAEIDSTIEELGQFRRLVIRYDVRQEKLEESLRKVFTLLAKLKMYVRPARLDETRMQFTQNLAFYQDDVFGMNDLMGWSAVCGDLSLCDLDAQAQMYEDLTCEDLLNTAQILFRPENLTISVQHNPALSGMKNHKVLNECRAMLD